MPPGAGQPAINLPPATAWLIGIMVAIHGLRSLLPPEANAWILANLAFVPGYYLLPPPLSWQEIIAPLSHQFLHGGWGHLAVNGLALAAKTPARPIMLNENEDCRPRRHRPYQLPMFGWTI